MDTDTIVIPLASGKGGVGKSFLTANLAIALAKMGHATVAVDMDLGASNLHSHLGLVNRFPGIGDFLKARCAGIEDLLVPTEIPNLQFLPGDGMAPFMANIPYAQKVRLLSRITKLPADYILLDLGAGTSFNTLDYFRLSRQGLLITTPDYPSVINMLVFLRNFLLRVIEANLNKNQYVRGLLRSLYKQPMTDQGTNINAFRSDVAARDSEGGEIIAEICHKIRPHVIFNMCDHPDEVKVAERINKSLKKKLCIEADFFGFVFADPTIRVALKKGTPFLRQHGESMAGESIARIARRIVKFWNKPVDQSAQRLSRLAEKVYEHRLSPSSS
jgi:flagellar biosynthesis protein FlhG